MRGVDRTIADAGDTPGLLRLPVGGYSATEFDMSGARVEALMQGARNAARVYLEDFERRIQ